MQAIDTLLLANKDVLEKVIADLRNSTSKEPNKALVDYYNADFNEIINTHLGSEAYGSKYFDLQQRFKLNTAKFSAAKAYQITKIIERQQADKNGVERDDATYTKYAKLALRQAQAWQNTETNTATARVRSAKQWSLFQEPGRIALYPNLKWISSRSATKREAHELFYNKVWAKNSPFWDNNQPGSLWNCKCNWTETDEAANGQEHDGVSAKGLEGNPASTGMIFSNNASYYTPNAVKAIGNIVYKDALSSMNINVMADMFEIADNVRTGRILIANNKDMDLAINFHSGVKNVKNPEYTINGMIADAKRINSWNVASSFSSALGQECKVVVIDLFNMQNNKLKLGDLTQAIRNRYANFTEGDIKECYVVYKNKSVLIKSSLFEGITSKNKTTADKLLFKILEGLL